MNLRQLDLNLLVALDALLKTRHVTRAARTLGIGQPGMSAALGRLRQVFGDDLLVKQGSEMRPTARALELEPEIRRVLRDVERLIYEPDAFVPRESRRGFTIRMSDLLSFLILPGVSEQLSREAPGTAIETVHLSPEATLDALEVNRVDMAVSTGLAASKSIDEMVLREDQVVVVIRSGHPAIERVASLDGFLALRHVKIAQSPIDDRFADRQLSAAAVARTVALTVPHWLAVPEIVARSDLVATMPLSIAGRFATDGRIELHRPPFDETGFRWSLYWHRRHRGDRGHAWLRGVVAAVAADALATPIGALPYSPERAIFPR